jgi:PKD repeat protein
MKMFTKTLLLFLSLLMISGLFAQKPKVAQKPIDSKVDAMWYWMRAAREGLVPFNPKIPVKPAKVLPPATLPKGVTADSPDVATYSGNDATESEVSIFVDPNDPLHVLNSNNSTDWDGSSVNSVFGANYFISSDGGLTWGGSIHGAGGDNSGDPAALIGLNGREYVGYIASDGGQGVAYSDNGSTWTHVQTAVGPGGYYDLLDKNHLWIDNSTSSPYEGNLYNAWTRFESGHANNYRVEISRSTDDGISWSTPVNISSGTGSEFDHGVNLQTGPNGEVYAVWAIYNNTSSDLNEDAIGFAKSTDGGATWQSPTMIISNIKGIRDDGVSKNMRVNSFPVMAVDISNGANSGNIYVVWSNYGTPGINTGTNISVYMIRSTDGGANWSTPVRVNQGTFANGKEAYEPWITCDPVTGVLSTIFYDDRNTASTDCETWVANSFDAGATWTDFRVSDVSFTPSAISGLASGYFGDYLGIAAYGGHVYPVWTDNRDAGKPMAYVSPFTLGLNAAFAADATEVCSGSGVQFTDMSTGNPTGWTWDFPGGSPSSYVGQNPPVVTYSSTGTYDVSLTVTEGGESSTETKTAYITVKNVIADFTPSALTVIEENTLTFTDNSSCSPTSWNWTFNGGSPASFNGQNPPAILYSTAGIYDVVLTVSNASGTDTKTIQVECVPPAFNMTNGSVTTCTGHFYDSGGDASNYANNENYTMTFYPATSGSMMQVEFLAFDVENQSSCSYDKLSIFDGEDSSATLLGEYCGTTNPGTFTATNSTGALTFVFTSDGSVTRSGWDATLSCFSLTDPPEADFSASPVNTIIDEVVSFTDLSSHAPTSWSWHITPSTHTFVGGTNAASQNPQVTFQALGNYSVELTATNAYGSDVETKTNYIEIVEAGVFPFEDDFESDSGWTLSGEFERGSPSGLGGEHGNPDPASAFSGTHVLGVDLSGLNTQLGDYEANLPDRAYQAISPIINCVGHSTVTLSFQQWLNVESSSYDHAYIDVSNDGGSTWNEVWANSASITNDNWSLQMIDISTYAANQSTVQIRFAMGQTDDSWFYSGWNIDDFKISEDPIPQPPLADFEADNTTPFTTDIVTLTDLSANDPSSWSWTFDPATVTFVNGTDANSQNPQVTFDAADTYTVTLEASNAAGSDTETKNAYITSSLPPAPPIADFEADNTNPMITQTVLFTDLSANVPTSWSWSFSPSTVTFVNGTDANSQNPQVTFDEVGVYTVTLLATNAEGSDDEVKVDYIDAIEYTCSYCSSSYSNTSDDNISNVTIGTINNSSGSVGYEDFTAISTDLSLGSTNAISVDVTVNGSWVQNVWVWIDWNQDCDFDDTNEAFDLGETDGTAGVHTISNTIQVPGNAFLGSTRMRIIEQYNSDPSSCSTGTYGETEDYSVNVIPNTQPPVADFVADITNTSPGQIVTFTDLSSNTPDSWTWSFTPSTVTFEGGTNANSQNPQVSFNANGSYTVSLTVSNAYGNDTEVKDSYIIVADVIYCDASGNGTDEYISRVQLGSIDNTSGQDYYADYTSLSTDLGLGESYDITVENGNVWTNDDLGIWIDWNQDGDFEDVNENIVCEIDDEGQGTFTFVVPDDALSGTSRMRVRIKWSGSDCGDPCGTTSYGEVEDYSVNITGGEFELSLKEYLDGAFNGTDMNASLSTEIPLSQPFGISPWDYNGTESVAAIPAGVVDWVLIELRDAPTPDAATGTTMIDRRAAFILTDGQIVDIDGVSNLNFSNSIVNNLYVVIWQLNHVGVMSASSPTNTGGVMSYDFTSDVDQVYGGVAAHKEIASGIWGMAGGDGDHNGVINLDDISNVWNSETGTFGYKAADFNLNTEVDNVDKNDVWLPNSGKTSAIPAAPGKANQKPQIIYNSMVKCQIPR